MTPTPRVNIKESYNDFIDNLKDINSTYINSNANYFNLINQIITHGGYGSISTAPDDNTDFLGIDLSSSTILPAIDNDTFHKLLISAIKMKVHNIGPVTAPETDNNSFTSDRNLLKFVKKHAQNTPHTIGATDNGDETDYSIYVTPDTEKIMNIISSLYLLEIMIDILEAYKYCIDNGKDTDFEHSIDEIRHIFVVNANALRSGPKFAYVSNKNKGYFMNNSIPGLLKMVKFYF